METRSKGVDLGPFGVGDFITWSWEGRSPTYEVWKSRYPMGTFTFTAKKRALEFIRLLREGTEPNLAYWYLDVSGEKD